MHHKAPELLEDIRNATVFIGAVTDELTLDDYRTNRLLRQGVERNLGVLSEAVKRLVAVDLRAAEHLGDYRRIIAFDDSLTREYELVDHEPIWQTIRTQVVSLRRSTEELLRRFERLPRG